MNTRTKPHRFALLLATTMLSVMGCAALSFNAAYAQADVEKLHDFKIPAKPVRQALNDIGRISGVAIVFNETASASKTASAVQGSMSTAQAIDSALSGTGLVWHFTNSNTVTIADASVSSSGIVTAPGGATVLNTITVQGAGATTEGSGSYTADAVTITKGEQDIRHIPQSVSVVTRKQMDDRNVITVDDALEEAPGIALYDSPMGARYVFSRGFMVDTYQYDGVNRSLYYPQANSFSEDMAAYDRVEVLRGATGLLQGAGNPGAAVNMVRKRPLDQKKLTITQQISSDQNYNTEIDATGPLNTSGSLRGRIVGSFNDREYFTDLAHSRNLFLYGIMEADLSENTTIGFGGSYKRKTSTPCFHGLPMYSDGSDIGLARDTCLGQSWNRWDTDQISLFADVSHEFNDRWKWKTSVSYWNEKHDVKYEFSEGAIDPVTLSGSTMYAGLFDMETLNVALDSYVDGKYDLFGRTHSVTFGASINNLISDNDYSLARLGISQNVFDPVRIPEIADTWLEENRFRGAKYRAKLRQEGIYGLTRVSVADPLTVIFGGRVSWYKMTSRYRDTGEDFVSPYSENGVFTPYGGIVYDLSKDWSIYASYTSIFKPQDEVTADGDPLKPIEGANYEMGIKGSLLDGALNTSFALFRIDNKNRAEFDADNYPCATGMWGECYVASGKVRSQGFEVEANGELFPNFQLAASYTYAHTEYLEGENDISQSFATYNPEHIVKIWGDYQFTEKLEGLSVGTGVRYQTESSRKTRDVTVSQPAYAVWSARIGYKINDHFSAALNVDNIFDKKYYQTVSAPGWGNFYGEPRSYTLSLKATF
ncbi:TonB-dependent receptor [Ochrobactrum sp. RH2CCR150]|uniref:TonB-dependent siderophore receptor n=1 Tax=Ochrobactrum sp. RH2CCR150 TaxID=2587044 RepID=UPI0015F94F79|nr:outer membrane receptor for ferric coprogen and ferric-rhodotorulic acid [Ochrobactrum sp. RH2CCR150]